jgi:hypothetical protein
MPSPADTKKWGHALPLTEDNVGLIELNFLIHITLLCVLHAYIHYEVHKNIAYMLFI